MHVILIYNHSDSQQFHQYQQHKQSLLTKGHMSCKTVLLCSLPLNNRRKMIVRFVDIGRIVNPYRMSVSELIAVGRKRYECLQINMKELYNSS